ncbi:hypothetical protein MG293_017316 [Ovis ammon polii]|uniref:Uncharacterized protein n=1 Tax=Ovis ammon polii TaxID=230172 RepID=A0AAD4TR63_OVIAM|nr:hypothetical protein MG293_017316 [Ovis ammon polii]
MVKGTGYCAIISKEKVVVKFCLGHTADSSGHLQIPVHPHISLGIRLRMVQPQERRHSARASVRLRCRSAWAHVTPGAGPAPPRPHQAAAAGQRDDHINYSPFPCRNSLLPVIRNSRKRRNGRRVGEKKVRRGGEKSREDTTGEDKFLSVSVKSRVPLLTCDGKVAWLPTVAYESAGFCLVLSCLLHSSMPAFLWSLCSALDTDEALNPPLSLIQEGANGHVNEGKVENRKVSRTKGNSHTARLGAVWEILPPFFEARIVCFVKIFTTNQDENVKVDLACGLGYCVSAAPHPQQLRLRENGAVGFIQSYGELISVEVGKRGRAGPLALESTPAAGNRREKWQRWCSGKDDGSRAVRPNRQHINIRLSLEKDVKNIESYRGACPILSVMKVYVKKKK